MLEVLKNFEIKKEKQITIQGGNTNITDCTGGGNTGGQGGNSRTGGGGSGQGGNSLITPC